MKKVEKNSRESYAKSDKLPDKMMSLQSVSAGSEDYKSENGKILRVWS